MTFKIIKYAIIFIILTILTQVGGVIFIISRLAHQQISKRFNQLNFKDSKALTFLLFYCLSTFLIIPTVAPYFGRVPLPISSSKTKLQPLSPVTYLFNRHYVTPELKTSLIETSNSLNKKYNNTTVQYLDANFPFIDEFPLFPHLSHNDGEKVDLAFLYFDTLSKALSNSTPSYIGYGAYVEPNEKEANTAAKCEQLGYWQYGLLGKLCPKKSSSNLILHEEATRELLLILSETYNIQKIFIEPHLKTRLQLNRIDKIRFHGCHAVRHDDHIHIQQ